MLFFFKGVTNVRLRQPCLKPQAMSAVTVFGSSTIHWAIGRVGRGCFSCFSLL